MLAFTGLKLGNSFFSYLDFLFFFPFSFFIEFILVWIKVRVRVSISCISAIETLSSS